ncbi:TPA: DUF736 family protein [Klebsiella pneumoniae]|uniref:DUF736 family protein n=1 Tax=Burkholderia cepacia TaxID=292 RepID=UPI0035192FB9|nr:DUF736 family protein [Klebsiella pneumoniae]HCQ8693176.1 DUF736 family protein [Klebsiella pneumoniae]
MSITGQLTKKGEAFEGFIASERFDHDIRILKNPSPQGETSPDYEVFTLSPRGRTIRIGGVWHRTSRQDNAFLSLSAKVQGEIVNANIFPADDGDANKFEIVEWKV